MKGKWRITKMPDYTSNFPDMVEKAYILFDGKGGGEFAFGCVTAGGELEYSRTIVFFRWSGFDEGDEISGDGSAELQDDGSIEIELSFDNGDGAILTGRRD